MNWTFAGKALAVGVAVTIASFAFATAVLWINQDEQSMSVVEVIHELAPPETVVVIREYPECVTRAEIDSLLSELHDVDGPIPYVLPWSRGEPYCGVTVGR